jgi:hypothetical protein
MAEFRVVIEGLELDDETTRTINDDIQKAVLGRLADHDLTTSRPHRGVVLFRPHPQWWGLVARIVPETDLRTIASVAADFEQFRR